MLNVIGITAKSTYGNHAVECELYDGGYLDHGFMVRVAGEIVFESPCYFACDAFDYYETDDEVRDVITDIMFEIVDNLAAQGRA